MVQGRAPAPLGNCRANEEQKQMPLSETGHMVAVRVNVQPTGKNGTSSHPEPLGQVKYNKETQVPTAAKEGWLSIKCALAPIG